MTETTSWLQRSTFYWLLVAALKCILTSRCFAVILWWYQQLDTTFLWLMLLLFCYSVFMFSAPAAAAAPSAVEKCKPIRALAEIAVSNKPNVSVTDLSLSKFCLIHSVFFINSVTAKIMCNVKYLKFWVQACPVMSFSFMSTTCFLFWRAAISVSVFFETQFVWFDLFWLCRLLIWNTAVLLIDGT